MPEQGQTMDNRVSFYDMLIKKDGENSESDETISENSNQTGPS